MRLLTLAAAAFVAAAALTAGGGSAAAQSFGQSCLMHENTADKAASEPVRRYLELRPGSAVSACSSDAGVSYQALSPVRIEPPGVCRMNVRRLTEAGLAAAATAPEPQAGAFEFMAEPDAGECPARGKGRWVAVTDVSPEDFLRIDRFALALARGGPSAGVDRACRKREDKLRRLAAGHALISVRREAPGLYAIQMLRSGMGYAVQVALTADGACVRGYGQFIV
jgi:hypothetical protein